jgi:predicted RNase H-like HicB family nuclease
MTTEYTILIHQAEEGGFWSEIPALPGCYSQGETIEETLENAREAIEAHLMALKEENVNAPVEEGLIIGRVRVEALDS